MLVRAALLRTPFGRRLSTASLAAWSGRRESVEAQRCATRSCGSRLACGGCAGRACAHLAARLALGCRRSHPARKLRTADVDAKASANVLWYAG